MLLSSLTKSISTVDPFGGSRPPKVVSLQKKNISLVIYIFRGHVRAYMKVMKCSSKLYILWFCRCGFSVIQVKVSKFTENHFFKRTESQEEIQTT